MILVVVAVAQLMVVLDATMVNIALPSGTSGPGWFSGLEPGGLYSDELLDNLGRPSARRIFPQFRHLRVGDRVPMSGKPTPSHYWTDRGLTDGGIPLGG